MLNLRPEHVRMGKVPGVLAALVLLVSLTTNAPAQFRPERPQSVQQFTFYQPVVLFGPDTSRCRVDLPVRIDQSFFVAVRNTDTSFPFEFQRRGELLVELVDSIEGTVARDISQIQIGAHTDEVSEEPRLWYESLLSFEVTPGVYRVNFDLTDLESHRNFNDRSGRVVARLPHRDSISISTPLFIRWPEGGRASQHLTPSNYGGDLLFGAPAGVLLEVQGIPRTDSTLSVHYSIRSVGHAKDEKPEITLTDSVIAPVLRNRILSPHHEEHEYVVSDGGDADPAIVILPMPAQRLALRSYILTLTVAGGPGRKEETVPFRMVWPDMPQSLKDVDYALDILRYITTPSVLDSLRSGNFEKRRDNLENFWKSRDASPATAYNEVMTEYYRRVDHARRTYGTLHAPDGAATDRGRVYILYGPPSDTRRTLNPSSIFEEIWTYAKLNKEFTFVDRNRNGNYELVHPARP